jgi:hypothetical protein
VKRERRIIDRKWVRVRVRVSEFSIKFALYGSLTDT